jgi:hypothetical protein
MSLCVAFLREKHSELYAAAEEIYRDLNVTVINDPTFENLKGAWCLIRDLLASKPNQSKASRQKEIRDILGIGRDGQEWRIVATGTRESWTGVLVSFVRRLLPGGNQGPELTDPELIQAVQPPLSTDPEVTELTGRIVSSLQAYVEALLATHVKKTVEGEKARQLDMHNRNHQKRAKRERNAADSALHEQLAAKIIPETP